MTRAKFTKARFSKTRRQVGEELGGLLAEGLSDFQDFYAKEGTEIIETYKWTGYLERDTGNTVTWYKSDGRRVQDVREIDDTGFLANSLQKPEPKVGGSTVTAVVGWDAYYAEQVITGDYIGMDGKPFYRTPRDWVTLARERVPVAPFIQEKFK
jgi:hypothetical protein